MSRYTGTNYRKLSDAKKPDLSTSSKPSNVSPCTRKFFYEIEETAESEQLTIDDFAHAYRFLVITHTAKNKPLPAKQVDKFIAMYYSHIKTKCVSYVLTYNSSYVPEPADQAEVEAAAIARIDSYLANDAKENN